jgi:hypothetical protein
VLERVKLLKPVCLKFKKHASFKFENKISPVQTVCNQAKAQDKRMFLPRSCDLFLTGEKYEYHKNIFSTYTTNY